MDTFTIEFDPAAFSPGRQTDLLVPGRRGAGEEVGQARPRAQGRSAASVRERRPCTPCVRWARAAALLAGGRRGARSRGDDVPAARAAVSVCVSLSVALADWKLGPGRGACSSRCGKREIDTEMEAGDAKWGHVGYSSFSRVLY